MLLEAVELYSEKKKKKFKHTLTKYLQPLILTVNKFHDRKLDTNMLLKIKYVHQ